MSRRFLTILIIGLVTVLIFARPVFSQQSEPPQPPSDPSAPWNPPSPSGTGNSGGPYQFLIVPGGGGAAAAWMTDYAYNKKDVFKGSETMYLWVVSPFSCYWLWWYEYYPPGNLPQGRWMWPYVWYGPTNGAGTYVIGPISPEPNEPRGLHSERIWLMDCASLQFTDTIARWTYQVDPSVTSVTSAISLSQTQTTPGQTVSVSASLSPIPTGGTLSISVSQNGALPTTISSSPATSGNLAVSWTPPGSGSYSFTSTFSGYIDTASNVQYSQSSSAPTTLTVALIPTTLTLSASPISVSIDSLTKNTQPVTLSGILSPTIQSALVVVVIDGPSGRTVRTEVVIGGAFSDSFTPTQAGAYSISASYEGDSSHQPSQASQTISVSEDPTTLYMVIVASVAIVAGVVVAAGRRRRKSNAKSSLAGASLGAQWIACPNCRTMNNPTATFCRHCRTRLH